MLKFVPMIVTVVPMGPLFGVNEMIVGNKTVVTVKLVEEVTVVPATATAIGPVEAPAGTVTVMLVELLVITVAAIPLSVTVLLAGVVLKLVPEIITVVPTGPDVGEKEVMVGGCRIL